MKRTKAPNRDQIEQVVIYHPKTGTGFEVAITQGEIEDAIEEEGLTIGGIKAATEWEVGATVLSIAQSKFLSKRIWFQKPELWSKP